MSVAVLRHGDYLIASIQSDLSDSQVLALRDDLAQRVGRERIRGIVVDVSALDVMDSFVARSLRSIALTTRLGFSRTDATLIATAISEIARNIVVHVGTGEVRMRGLEENSRCGLLVLALDEGA